MLQHFGGHALRETEKSAKIGRNDGRIILLRVIDEGFGDENARIVDEGVNAAKASEPLRNDAIGRRRIGNVTGDVQTRPRPTTA